MAMFSKYTKVIFFLTLALTGIAMSFYSHEPTSQTLLDPGILAYEINPQKQHLRFYWKNESGENYTNFQRLKSSIESKGNELLKRCPQSLWKKGEEMIPHNPFTRLGTNAYSLTFITNITTQRWINHKAPTIRIGTLNALKMALNNVDFMWL